MKGKSHECPQCGARFSKPAHLRQHSVSHTHERPFVCPVDGCGNTYSRKYHLSRHMASLHQGKTFDCPLQGCAFKLTTQYGLQKHLKVCLEKKREVRRPTRHVCPFPDCAKPFQFASALKYHVEKHSGHQETVECACVLCEKKFANLSELNEHNATEHRKIQCPECEKPIVRYMLRRHLNRMHSNDDGKEKELYPCTIAHCTKSFSSAYNRDHHIKSYHCLERPFECAISGCSKLFSLKQSLQRHQKKFHGYLPVPEDVLKKDEARHKMYSQTGRKRKSMFCAMNRMLHQPIASEIAEPNEARDNTWASSPNLRSSQSPRESHSNSVSHHSQDGSSSQSMESSRSEEPDSLGTIHHATQLKKPSPRMLGHNYPESSSIHDSSSCHSDQESTLSPGRSMDSETYYSPLDYSSSS